MTHTLMCESKHGTVTVDDLENVAPIVQDIYNLLVAAAENGFATSFTIHHGGAPGDYRYYLAAPAETPVSL